MPSQVIRTPASLAPNGRRGLAKPRNGASAAIAGAAAPLKIRVTPLGLLSFFCAAFAGVKLNLVGEVYVAELLLLLGGLIALFSGGTRALASNRVFWLLFAAAILSLFGYVISDMIRGTASDLFMRGWARNVIILTSFVSLSLLFAADRRNVWWAALGYGIGGFLYYKLGQNLSFGDINNWKFAYSVPAVFVVACLTAVLPLRIVALLLVGLGAYSMFEDYRIHGAVCVLVGALTWTAAAGKGRISPQTLIKLGVAGVVGLLAVSSLLNMSTSNWHEQRRERSNEGRLLGLKQGFNAISQSPVVGYGSWGRTPELYRIGAETIAKHNETAETPYVGGLVVSAHSQVLNAWIEGGIFGASLFLLMGIMLIREAWFAVLRRPGDLLTPLLLFIILFQMWHLINSPLGSGIRLFFSFAMAALVVLYAERKLIERANRPQRRFAPGAARPPLIASQKT